MKHNTDVEGCHIEEKRHIDILHSNKLWAYSSHRVIQPENVADVMTRVSDRYAASHERRLMYTFERMRVCAEATVLLFNRGSKNERAVLWLGRRVRAKYNFLTSQEFTQKPTCASCAAGVTRVAVLTTEYIRLLVSVAKSVRTATI